MALNPNIILAGRQPDIINTLARSTQAASGVNQVRDQNALRQLYQTQGPGIVAGDQGALNAYAQIDPNAAFGIGQRQQAGRRADQANTRAQATFDANMSKQQQYEELTRALEVINGAQTPEQWDQAAQQYGANDLVGQFGNKQAILDKLLPFQERLAGEIARAQPPQPLSTMGKVQTDINVGILPEGTPIGGRGGLNVTLADGTQITSGEPVSTGTGRTKPGWEKFVDPETGERTERPIRGGPVWNEYVDASQKTKGSLESFLQQDAIVMDDINRALDLIEGGGVPTTGIAGALGSAIAGTPMFALGEMLTTIRGNIGFDKLADMRANSPTGGALGNVSEQENRTLQATSGSLAQSNRASDLAYNLRRIRDARTAAKNRLIKAYNDDFRQVGVTFGGDTKGVTADDIASMTREQLLAIDPSEFGTMDTDALTAYINAVDGAGK